MRESHLLDQRHFNVKILIVLLHKLENIEFQSFLKPPANFIHFIWGLKISQFVRTYELEILNDHLKCFAFSAEQRRD